MTVAVSRAVARRRRGGDLRLDREHRRKRRRLRRPGRTAGGGDRPGGKDRDRQARPGADARSTGDRDPRQLRRCAADRPGAGRAPPDRVGQLGQPLPDRGPEDGRLRGLRGPGRPARRAGHPGRQRRQRHRLPAGLPTSPAGAMPMLLGFQAAGAAPLVSGTPVENPETVASAIRIGNPARWEEAMDAVTSLAGTDRRGRDDRSSPPTAARLGEGVFCEPASAASVAGILTHGLPESAEGARRRDRRLRAHRPRAQGPRHRARQGPAR